jgi:hypothetical protein
MKFSESIELLSDLGMIEWMSRDIDESTRLVINAVGEYFFEDNDPYDFRPYIESEYVYDYFRENSWEIDWYSILSRDFVESVELNINSIAISINAYDPMMGIEETESYVESWVHEWRAKVVSMFKEQMSANA